MRTCVFVIAALLFCCSFGSGQQPIGGRALKQEPTGRPIKVAQGRYQLVASVKDIMEAMLEPATEVIFDAVSPTILPNGSLEKAPTSDDAWAAVRNSAIVMSEGGNLLMLGRRRINSIPSIPAAATSARRGTSPQSTELMPQVAARVSRSNKRWIELAQALIAAGSVTLRAVDTRDAVALLRAGDVIDAACETCHQEYWYRH